MKKESVMMCLLWLTMTVSAFCQVRPGTLQDENLKGNVFCVKTETFWYKENFGNPIAGETRRHPCITFYDELGRAFLERCFLGFGDDFKEKSTFLKYDDTKNTIIKYSVRSQKTPSGISQLEAVITNDNSNYEKLIHELKPKYPETTLYYKDVDLYEYDDNKALISYTAGCRGTLKFKYIAKKQTDGSYEWTFYDEEGTSRDHGIITYRNGRIIKKTAYTKNSLWDKYHKGRTFYYPGKYTYNAQGKLIEEVEYYSMESGGGIRGSAIIHKYNEKGDIIKSYTPQSSIIYSDYIYDSHGNWISRVRDNHEKKIFEKRTIIYADSKEQLKEKSQSLIKALHIMSH